MNANQNLKENETRIIFLDRNHPIVSLKNVSSFIDLHMSAGLPYTKLYLIPEISGEKLQRFPFSYTFIAQCMYHGTTREKHPFLNNKDISQLFTILLTLMNSNRDVKYN